MAHSTLAVDSLIVDSASIEAIAQYVTDELQEVLDVMQPNAQIITQLQGVLDTLAEVLTDFS